MGIRGKGVCLAAVMLLISMAGMTDAESDIIVSSEPDNANPMPGETITVLVNIDLTGTSYQLAEYTIEVNWDPAVIEYQGVSGGTTEGFQDLDSVTTEVASGKLTISWFDLTGSGGKVNVASVQFKAVGSTGDATFIDIVVSSLSSTALDDLLPQHNAQSGQVTILGPPQLLSPADLSYIPVGQTFSRTWNAVPNATSYQLQESTDSEFTDATTHTLTGTEYVSSFSESYTIDAPVYWRVRAEVNGEYGGWSEVWRVYTDLGSIQLLSPVDLEYVEPGTVVTYKWSPVENASEYQLVTHSSADFSGVTPVTVTGTTYSATIEGEYTVDAPYFWRVRAKVGGQYGEWSETWRIVTRMSIEPPTDVQVSDVPDDNGHSLLVTWTLSVDDERVTHYNIYRSRNSTLSEDCPGINSFGSIDALIEAEATSTILIASVPAGENSFTDPYVPLTGETYYYWVEAVSETGSSEKIAAGNLTTSVENTPLAYRISAPYPNPFNSSVNLDYEIPVDCHVELTIYDALGRKIAVVRDEKMKAGSHRTVWDGKNAKGVTVGSGVYFYSFKAGNYRNSGKIVFLR